MLLKMSVSGGILILSVILLRAFAIHYLPKRMFVLLWDIVIVRLLLPFDLPLSFSITAAAAKLADPKLPASTILASVISRENAEEAAAASTSLFHDINLPAVNWRKNRLVSRSLPMDLERMRYKKGLWQL